MLPKEIANIIIKYQSKNDELSTINAAIDEISYQLNNINDNIAEKFQLLLSRSDSLLEEEQLLHDSQTLRKYISTISMINVEKNNITKMDAFYSTDNIDLYLCYDNICPKCNWKMEEVVIQYTAKRNNGNIKKNIITQKCANCNKSYVIDYDLDGIDTENTNIVIHYDYLINDELNFHDVIVLTTTSSCTAKKHNLTDIVAKIPIVNEDGSIIYIERNVAFCRECNKYIMLKSEFLDINGLIACKVIDQTITSEQVGHSSDEIDIVQKQSILYQYGYNVRTKYNLSDKQRHLILSLAVESGILSRGEIISHLDTLIERGEKIPSWMEATNKWKQDKHYIARYNTKKLASIVPEKLILKYRK